MKLSEADIPAISEWITIPEAALMLGISRQHAYKKARDGDFRTIHRIGNSTTFVVGFEEINSLVVSV